MTTQNALEQGLGELSKFIPGDILSKLGIKDMSGLGNIAGLLGTMTPGTPITAGQLKAAEQQMMAIMPQEIQQTIKDKFDGRPSEFIGFLGNLGLTGPAMVGSSDSAGFLRSSMLASSALGQKEAGMFTDTIMSGMFRMQDEPEKLALIQRSIASQGAKGIAAMAAAMKNPDIKAQDKIWDEMKDSPEKAGEILVGSVTVDPAMVSKIQTELSPTQLKPPPTQAEIQKVTDELDAVRGKLSGEAHTAFKQVHESAFSMFGNSALSQTLAVMPEAERQKFYEYLQKDPGKIEALAQKVKESPSFFAMQMSDLQAKPTADAAIETLLGTGGNEARRDMLARVGFGMQNADGSTGDASTFVQQFLSGQGGFDISQLPPWLHQILGAGNYFAANLFGGKLLGMAGAFAQEFMDGGTTTNHSRYDQAMAAARVSKWERVLGISGGKTGQIRAMDADGKIVETAANDAPAAARSPASAPGTTPEQQQKPGG